MPRIFDFGGRDVERSQTIAGLRALKGSGRRAAQVTAETADEAAAAEAAKKLLADMGGEMKQFYMVMGEFDFVGICDAPDDAVMVRYVLQLGGPRLRAHENAEGVPRDRLPRNHPLARLSCVGKVPSRRRSEARAAPVP